MSQGFKHRAARAATKAMLGGLGPTQASIPSTQPKFEPKVKPNPSTPTRPTHRLHNQSPT